jgi:DNA-binding NarL/FixJ family response regulator
LEATRWLRSSARPPVVILLSTYDEEDFGRARDCGAAAYVAKSAFGTERLAAVWASASGT